MKRLFFRTTTVIAVVTSVIGITSIARAGSSITFTGSGYDSGDSIGLAASATFTNLGGGDLEVTLVNTYTGDTPDQGDVLTGIFFDGANGLTPVSAAAGAGAVTWSGKTESGPLSSAVLGTEWAYSSDTGTQAPGNATAGIISSGYYTPGTGNFSGPPDDMLDGSAYGILSEGYAGSDKGGLSNRIYEQDSMVFVLGGFDGNVSDIIDVTFQYGTALSEPSLTGTPVPDPVPEPATLLPLAMLVALLGIRHQRLARQRRLAPARIRRPFSR